MITGTILTFASIFAMELLTLIGLTIFLLKNKEKNVKKRKYTKRKK